MKKTLKFLKELAELRSHYGEKEYSRAEILPDVEELLIKHGINTLRDAASQVLDEAERQEDQRQLDQPDLFAHEAHVALGEGHRVKRGCMIREQLHRRSRVVDRNKMAQDRAWAKEKTWLLDREQRLEGYPPSTMVKDVVNEDGTPRHPPTPPPPPHPPAHP